MYKYFTAVVMKLESLSVGVVHTLLFGDLGRVDLWTSRVRLGGDKNTSVSLVLHSCMLCIIT